MPTLSKVREAKKLRKEINLEFSKPNPSNEVVRELRSKLRDVFKK